MIRPTPFLVHRAAAAAALAVVALVGVALIGVAVTLGWTQPADARLLAMLRHAGGTPWRRVVTDLTALGSAPLLLPLLAAGALLLLARRRPRDAAALLLIVLGGRLLVELIKQFVARDRPPGIEPLIVHGWSFPSAHAANSTVTLLALALLLARGGARRPLIGLATLTALAIGSTRLWLGVHWPSDVIAGWLLGTGWLALTIGPATAWVRRSAA